MSEHTECEKLAYYARRLAEEGLVAATDGNLSFRDANGTLWTTPSGFNKGELSSAMMVPIGSTGSGDDSSSPDLIPSSEAPLHVAIYAQRKDVNAVVHAHPPFATAFACTGQNLSSPLLSEAVLTLGPVPLVPFALPSTQALANGVAKALEKSNACLLANHGAVTVGADIRTAFFRMQTLEQAARVQAVARLIGEENPLSESVATALHEMGKGYRPMPLPNSCMTCPARSGKDVVALSREELMDLLTRFATKAHREL